MFLRNDALLGASFCIQAVEEATKRFDVLALSARLPVSREL